MWSESKGSADLDLGEVCVPDLLWASAPVSRWQREHVEAAMQIGEQIGEQLLEHWADQQPCPGGCGRKVGDHTRRQRRQCDQARPELTIVT